MKADYKVPHSCEFGVPCEHTSSGVTDCGEPAAFWIFWENENDCMWVCQRHLDHILEIEREDIDG